jgi:hypothetical protein
MNAKLTSKSDDWGTPADVIAAAVRVMGSIDLDPASSVEHNRTVGARRIITRAEDGLLTEWGECGSIFLNPPGGRGVARRFWDKLAMQRFEGGFDDAVFVCFSLEHLQTFQDTLIPPTIYPLCVPRRRLAFLRPDGTRPTSPTHANAIVYVPGRLDRSRAFAVNFSEIGAVLNRPAPEVQVKTRAMSDGKIEVEW